MTDEAARKSCFYICPIGANDTAVKKRSGQIFRHVVTPAIEPLGYDIVRADEIDQSGTITSQIINGLLEDDLVVADLTDHNPNVFYELAIRHATGKPYIQLIADEQKLPFDIQGLRTVFLDHRDLDSVAEAIRQIAAMAQRIDEGAVVDTPLTYALDIQSLRSSDNTEARGIADLIDEVASIKRHLTKDQRTAGLINRRETEAFRELIFNLAVGGRLTVGDVNFLVEQGIGNAHQRWLNESIIPIIMRAQDAEPPF